MPHVPVPHQSSSAHLGTGWSFPIRVNVQGQLMLSSGYRNVEESILIILKTTIGERIGLSQFGSELQDMAFAPLNSSMLVLLRISVEESLQRWEPRIQVDEVRAVPNPLRGQVDLIIDYRVVDQYDSRSLVYPFYLHSDDAAVSDPGATTPFKNG